MRTVNEVSKLTGISVRTLHYYDQIGLLKPSQVTDAGYRLYDDEALEKLQQIMLYRELEFPLKDIRDIMESSDFDRNRALRQQIEMLTLKKEHLENLIDFARGIRLIGVKTMDFSVFDTKKMDEYAKQAKEQWGSTKEYKEFEQKSHGRSKGDDKAIMESFMKLFAEFGELKDAKAEAPQVQEQVEKLQNFITEHFYHCSNDILFQLGQMYAAGGEFTTNIDKFGGEGTAKFTAEAIRIYCGK